jgi:hypothetical protein
MAKRMNDPEDIWEQKIGPNKATPRPELPDEAPSPVTVIGVPACTVFPD